MTFYPSLDLVLQRDLPIPPDAVWRAWTEPERIAQWWGKRGWSTPVSSVELDVRPGGVFRLNSINDEDGREITPERALVYDILVIAIGSVSNDFGTPGVKEHAIMLDTKEQAERFNRRLLNACVRAQAQEGGHV